ncbi:MAG: hypothetical protein ACOZNI_36165 [Myxococcota bacterium]
MNWEIAPRTRVDIVAFAGINLSGERSVVEIHPVGGRQGDVSTDYLKSVAIVGPVGTRVTFMTYDDPDTWHQQPWRTVKIMAGKAFSTKEGRPCVRVPDLDWLDAFDARRTDAELQCSFEEAPGLDGSKEWTYGRPGVLKGRIKLIKIDRFQ